MDEARALVKELMQLDDDHEVLFLHGGASTQFMQVPMNLLNENEMAAYTDTGIWGAKAIKEAKLFGHVEIVGSAKETNYTIFQKNFLLAQLLHICILQPMIRLMVPNGRIFLMTVEFRWWLI